MRKLIAAYLLVCFVFNLVAQEKQQQLFLSGYIKNLHEFSFTDRLDQLNYTTLLHNRLNFKYTPSEEIKIRLEIRNRLYFGEKVKDIYGFSEIISRDPGLVNLSWNIVNDGNALFNAAIDRALINYVKGNWDISLGRQRINWGMNLVWNPNDIFNTYNFLDFDYEERPGSDALRVQYYLDNFGKIEVAAKKGRRPGDHIVAAMYKFNKRTYDIQLICGVYQKDWMIGAGWAGNLKNAGFKGEVSYFVPYEIYLHSQNVLSASISLDYGFKKGLFMSGSFLYNSSTNDTASNTGHLIYAELTAKNLMPFKNSGLLQFSKEFTPIISGTAGIIYSPTRQSFIFLPGLKYALATNWELDLNGQSFFEFEDYKTLGNSFYLRMRWSF